MLWQLCIEIRKVRGVQRTDQISLVIPQGPDVRSNFHLILNFSKLIAPLNSKLRCGRV